MGRKPKSEDPVYSRIEEHRTRAGLSRQQLADAVGVHYQTVGYLERGEYAPSLALALRIAHLVNVPVEQLFSLTPFAEATIDTDVEESA
jgi:DNA-binding XRE family transcriptional regulator